MSTKTSIASALVTLVFLAVLRIARASVIMTRVPAPYGAGLVSTLGVLAVIAVAVVVDRLVRYFYWDGHLRRKRKRETPALIDIRQFWTGLSAEYDHAITGHDVRLPVWRTFGIFHLRESLLPGLGWPLLLLGTLGLAAPLVARAQHRYRQ